MNSLGLFETTGPLKDPGGWQVLEDPVAEPEHNTWLQIPERENQRDDGESEIPVTTKQWDIAILNKKQLRIDTTIQGDWK